MRFFNEQWKYIYGSFSLRPPTLQYRSVETPEGRLSKVYAGIISVGREDGDVEPLAGLEVEGGWR